MGNGERRGMTLSRIKGYMGIFNIQYSVRSIQLYGVLYDEFEMATSLDP